MRTTIGTILLVLTVLCGYAQCDQPRQQQPQDFHPSTKPYQIVLHVGEVFKICWSGEVICPVLDHMCDDSKVVNFVDTPDGLGFVGVSPGTTLCYAQSTNLLRRVFRITVR
jgi:hypothetical protein